MVNVEVALPSQREKYKFLELWGYSITECFIRLKYTCLSFIANKWSFSSDNRTRKKHVHDVQKTKRKWLRPVIIHKCHYPMLKCVPFSATLLLTFFFLSADYHLHCTLSVSVWSVFLPQTWWWWHPSMTCMAGSLAAWWRARGWCAASWPASTACLTSSAGPRSTALV